MPNVTMLSENYADFGPTLVAEMLAEHHGFKASRETVRKWMQEDGLWLSRKQRRTFHQPRLRRECFAELIQIDGLDHRWFEDRGDPCTLLVFIDDATSTLMELRFAKSESTFSYFDALESYLLTHGRPVAFYSDKHTVFRIPKPNEHMTGMTQFGRALAELNIEPDRLSELFCLRDKRYVTKDLTLKSDRKRIRLEVNDLTRGLVGKYVDVYEMPDGRIQVRAKDVVLPCTVFSPHQQRVTHAAITENKRLSAVLAHIKEEQEKGPIKLDVKPESARNGYKKTGRRPPGGPSKMEAYYERRRKERAAEANPSEITAGTSKSLDPLE